jgi:phosphohistidine phosphatase
MAAGLRLFFLRHGLADRDQFEGPDDAMRPLVAEGRRRMRVTAEFLARLDLRIDLILTSPLVRAVQTAEIVAARLGLDEAMHVDDRLGPGCDLAALAAILAGLPDDHRRLLLVGHEPSFSTLVAELTGCAVPLKKGALARVDLQPGRDPRGLLVWLLQPRVLLSCDLRSAADAGHGED